MNHVELQLYNTHKRRTLDRLSGKYALRARQVAKQHTNRIAESFIEALGHGRKTVDMDPAGFKKLIKPVFEDHRDEVIHVAVSDGIQEVSPDRELNLWLGTPLTKPIEDTLSVVLAGRRDKIVGRQVKRFAGPLQKKIGELIGDQVDAYLANLTRAYEIAAHDWLQGEDSVAHVKALLRAALQRTDNDATRIFRTATTNYFNGSRHEYFSQDTAVDYMELFAVTDGRISKICEDRHGFVVTIEKAGLKKYMPAFHPYCRTVQRPLISALPSHKVLIDRGLAMNESQFTPLPRGWA